MARLAVTTWNERVSPVFDVAEHFLLIDGPVDGPRERQACSLTEPGEQARLQWLMVHDVDVVICGAVSRQLAQRLRAAGVLLFSGVCGEVEAVVSAYHRGTLHVEPALRLPGVTPDVDAGLLPGATLATTMLEGSPARESRPRPGAGMRISSSSEPTAAAGSADGCIVRSPMRWRRTHRVASTS